MIDILEGVVEAAAMMKAVDVQADRVAPETATENDIVDLVRSWFNGKNQL